MMSNKGSRVTSPSKYHNQTYQHSYVSIEDPSTILYSQPSTYSTYSIPNKNVFAGTSVNTYQQSRFTTDQVSKLTGSRVEQGSVVKGQSRIEYVPYQKKVIDYQTRVITQKVPKTRKVVDYTQRKVVQQVPRQVIKQDFYAVQKITQYYKEVIPQSKVQIVPVQKKVKRIQYVPVEKQIVHYPQNEDWRSVQGQSRMLLQSQGIAVKPDAQYKPMQSDLIYKYTQSNIHNQSMPVGYVDLGSRRYLSTAPTNVNQNLAYSNVQSTPSYSYITGPSYTSNVQYTGNNSYTPGPYSYVNTASMQDLQFQPIQSNVQQQNTFINRVQQNNFNNKFTGNKYEYKYGNYEDFSSNCQI